MEEQKPNIPPPPPGVIQALTGGFNAVANQVALIIIPISFDVFLWMGPRLKVSALISPILAKLAALQPPSEASQMGMKILQDIIEGMNYFATMRTFPLGIFSLMTVNLSGKNPLGARIDLEIDSLFNLFAWTVLLTIAGWVGGSLYFYLTSRAALKDSQAPSPQRSLLQAVLLSLMLSFLLTLLSLPLGMLTVIGSMSFLANFFTVLLIFWIGMPIFFSSHAIFLDGRNAFASIQHSFRVVRFAMPSLGWFALAALLISQGMDLLWRVPPAESWMTLVGIFGHAFISTSLLAASFIYFRNLSAWVDSALEWLKSQKTFSVRA